MISIYFVVKFLKIMLSVLVALVATVRNRFPYWYTVFNASLSVALSKMLTSA